MTSTEKDKLTFPKLRNGVYEATLDWKIEVLNKDSLRMKGGVFERIK